MIRTILILCAIMFEGHSKNVLFLLSDDGGFEIGAYGNKIVQTPNLDSLAKKSLIFNQAFASVSSCSPSRSVLLSGRPNHENGMYGLHQGVHHFTSFDSLLTLPRTLARRGIATGIIGKKHVGPKDVYKFDFEETEENNSIMQVGRNITRMKLLARKFLKKYKDRQFFLYVAFHDPHRCGHSNPKYGNFCERFGSGEEGMGRIPDWTPVIYEPSQVFVPYYVQDTLPARQDIAAQYTTISRLDAGVGLIVQEIIDLGLADDTLIIYSSDNAIPFPAGRTNLYDSGLSVPLLISSPEKDSRKNQVTNSLTSHVDLVPTVLDWFGLDWSQLPGKSLLPLLKTGLSVPLLISSPEKDSRKNQVTNSLTSHVDLVPTVLDWFGLDWSQLPGKSLLPLLKTEPPSLDGQIFASHNLHEVTMYYPMRAIRTHRYKLIHNLNFLMPFPIDQDFYVSPTFQDLLNNTIRKKPTYWYRSLKDYYYRPGWELYDVIHDPEETNNLVHKSSFNSTYRLLKKMLRDWQEKTHDPWICGTTHVLINSTCLPLYNL